MFDVMACSNDKEPFY